VTHSHGPTPALIVSATHSGAGKTTVATSMIRGLRESGLRVQPFKLGPDFIDTAYLAEAAGRPAVNLDLWMMGADGVRHSFQCWSAGADVAVIEAMGALYDGADGGENGSAAEIAKLLDIPVVLVLDVWGMTRTAGAVLLGMLDFDPAVRIVGCVLNRIGGNAHRQMVEAALPDELRKLIVGAISREDPLLIPERHLGLLTATENQAETRERKGAQLRAASGLDVARLTILAGMSERRTTRAPARRAAAPPQARLAIAQDAAFCFYYEDNLRLLSDAGFELVPFRPTVDCRLPADVDAVYLGGGYPESFAAELAANRSLAAELRMRTAAGMPLYAECGGLLYLARSLTGFNGSRHEMSGVLPLDIAMDRAYLAIRYVTARTSAPSLLGAGGTTARGQEFHQSRITSAEIDATLYDITTSDGKSLRDGFIQGSVVASYVHLHFASAPGIAAEFLAAARNASRGSPTE
jgi:cobyrinic acid a,c-diamide synthase